MLLSCGPKKVAVVTKEGRFDLNTTQFVFGLQRISDCQQRRLFVLRLLARLVIKQFLFHRGRLAWDVASSQTQNPWDL
jgi:hypothetical protein